MFFHAIFKKNEKRATLNLKKAGDATFLFKQLHAIPCYILVFSKICAIARHT